MTAPAGHAGAAREIEPGLWRRGPGLPPLTQFRLAAFDMDSTLISIECIDEIADAVGRKAEVAAITEAAMRGEITDFRDSLRRRLALLAGVPAQALEAVYTQRLTLNPGVASFVAACREAGVKTLLVSGGFTFFSDRVKARLDMDFARANVLEIEGGVLTGRLVPQCWGDIVDGAEKRRTLLETASLLGATPAQCIAVGDGANDLPMMRAAAVSIGFHAKPAVRAEAVVQVNAGGLDRALALFGC
jgi:phosphoserine phosphatase